MNKNQFATTPPMGWNSYDYYDTMVNEDQIKASADYMAEHMKDSGWEYIVIDIEWYAYDTGSQRDLYQYIPFWKVGLDEYSRLIPCVDKFPSSANGMGFKPLADYVHERGLKFGIHIMRGISRNAVHAHGKLKGTERTANEIADPASTCFWNPDMYGVIPDREGAQEYYNSIFDLYAEWGVDFVKCDDICRMDAASAKQEIVMLHKAIMQCGRDIVLSLSPGPAKIEEAWHYEKYANMWRITDDFWDDWDLLLNMFERCELWEKHVSRGCYPDCDMLPVGYLGAGFGEERYTNFTKAEQVTMMTLWSIFRSPMMLGAALTKMDDWTLKLLTNKEVNRLITSSEGATQLWRDEKQAAWFSRDCEDGSCYLALFNLTDEEQELTWIGEDETIQDATGTKYKELWSGECGTFTENKLQTRIEKHGAKLFKLITK